MEYCKIHGYGCVLLTWKRYQFEMVASFMGEEGHGKV